MKPALPALALVLAAATTDAYLFRTTAERRRLGDAECLAAVGVVTESIDYFGPAGGATAVGGANLVGCYAGGIAKKWTEESVGGHDFGPLKLPDSTYPIAAGGPTGSWAMFNTPLGYGIPTGAAPASPTTIANGVDLFWTGCLPLVDPPPAGASAFGLGPAAQAACDDFLYSALANGADPAVARAALGGYTYAQVMMGAQLAMVQRWAAYIGDQADCGTDDGSGDIDDDVESPVDAAGNACAVNASRTGCAVADGGCTAFQLDTGLFKYLVLRAGAEGAVPAGPAVCADTVQQNSVNPADYACYPTATSHGGAYAEYVALNACYSKVEYDMINEAVGSWIYSPTKHDENSVCFKQAGLADGAKEPVWDSCPVKIKQGDVSVDPRSNDKYDQATAGKCLSDERTTDDSCFVCVLTACTSPDEPAVGTISYQTVDCPIPTSWIIGGVAVIVILIVIIGFGIKMKMGSGDKVTATA